MPKRRSIFTEEQKAKLAGWMARAKQLREDHGGSDPKEMIHFAPVVPFEYWAVALRVVPMVLRACGEPEIEVKPREDRREDDLLGAMREGE